MRKNLKIFFCIFFLLAFALPVLAVKPEFQISPVSEIVILYPKNEFFIRDNNFTLHFHVHNASGFALTNLTTDCLIHIYNYDNAHILESKLKFDGFDFEVALNSSFSNRSGIYPIALYCNSSNQEYGYLSGYYEITSDGYAKDDPASIPLLCVLVLVPIIFGGFMLYLASSLGDEHGGLKIGLMLLSFLSFTSAFNFALISVVKFLDMSEIQELIAITYMIMIIFFIVVVFYFFIYALVVMINNIKAKKIERFKY